MATVASRPRRDVHYESLDDFLADAERLAKMPTHTIGNWTYPQILDHLARTVTASLDGFGFKAPGWARLLIAPFVKNSFLTKTMKPGFKLPKRAMALVPANDLTVPAAMEKLRQALARYGKEPAGAEHPFFGKLASQEWNSVHARHAELHMSFVVPDEG
jgi:hypothetical protein